MIFQELSQNPSASWKTLAQWIFPTSGSMAPFRRPWKTAPSSRFSMSPSISSVGNFRAHWSSCFLQEKSQWATSGLTEAHDFSRNRVSSDELTWEILTALGDIVSLVTLNMTNNHITGAIPQTLRNLTEFRSTLAQLNSQFAAVCDKRHTPYYHTVW